MARIQTPRLRFRGGLSRIASPQLKWNMRLNPAKSFFLDRRQWQGLFHAGERRALTLAGAFVRTACRSLIRRRKRESRPGQAPTNRTGFLKRYILFWYNPISHQVEIGPIYFPHLHRDVRTLTQPNIPATLEHGGAELLPRRGARTFGPFTANRRIFIEARPYMRPGLQKAIPDIRRAFEGMITEGTLPNSIRIIGRAA